MRDYEPYFTEDGSVGLYSYADKDVYHSKYGALTEAWEKFILPSNIASLINKQKEINVLDVCFGIGYNTKALMSFVINYNNKKLKRKNFFKKVFNKFNNIDTLDNNNLIKENDCLLPSVDTIYDNKILSTFTIDCLDIDEGLIKLSPFFKTLKTPEEIFYNFVPDIFDCFETYYKIKNIFVNIASYFYPKNKKEITSLLDIKYKNMHIEKEYKINKFVHYILLNILSSKFQKNYIDENIKNIFKEKYTSRFLDKSFLKYAKFNQIFGYKHSSELFLSSFLHNIYYDHLSRRNKNIDFKTTEKLFNINFLIDDARKSILKLNKQYDCIFLDAFTYTKAPQLWSLEFVEELVNRLSNQGVLLTYSNSAQVRNTLLTAGLFVGKIYNDKSKKFIGTIASKDKSLIEHPLNNYELGLCATKAGIPYHDPNLSFSNKEILEFREYEFRHSNLMSSSKYMKIRNLREENEEI